VTRTRTRPRKRFGQHFLEPVWIDRVIRAIEPQPGQTFIEIGAGRGALTAALGERATFVAAYEIDRDLAAQLQSSMPPNVVVIPTDFLAVEEYRQVQAAGEVRVAGNLPYNVASPILFKLIDLAGRSNPAGPNLVDATVMMQREVADRLVAEPGTRDYGVMTVLIRHRAKVARLFDLPPGAFRPPPKVSSSLLRLLFHPPAPAVRSQTVFESVVRTVFTRRRKTLANALLAYSTIGSASSAGIPTLSPADALSRAGIDGRRRPETLSISEFCRLADVYALATRGPAPSGIEGLP
jgi:16S rRNA (adenine1518-N6/adenine1519-N6)-dimethyltransferase